MQPGEQSQHSHTTTQIPDKSQLNSELVEKEQVPDTGFHIIGNKEYGYFVALGTYRITKAQSKTKCLEMIETKDYELLLGLIGACIEADKKDRERELDDLLKNTDKELKENKQLTDRQIFDKITQAVKETEEE